MNSLPVKPLRKVLFLMRNNRLVNNDFEKCFDKWQASKNTMKYEQKVWQFSQVLAVMAKV